MAETGCNTDGRILAFVGANESGKTSLLDALVWLTDGFVDPLPPTIASRNFALQDEQAVVRATFELEKVDHDLLEDLDLAERIDRVTLQKSKNGTVSIECDPAPRRNPKPFQDVAVKLQSSRDRLASQMTAKLDDEPSESDEQDAVGDPIDSMSPADWVDLVLASVSNPEERWPDGTYRASRNLIDWLAAPSPTSKTDKPRDSATAELLRSVAAIADARHPRDSAESLLRNRIPKFVLFQEKDRVLSTVHVIADEGSRTSPQPALVNLLKIAEVDLGALWHFTEIGDGSSRESYVEAANERLQDFFTQAWNQSRVSVRLKATDNALEVWLKEFGRGGQVTNIEERSDGLRTFVALAAFLASQHLAVPPVLLIDEAETHLHIDAQADLVGVLLKQVDARQVFYTTHSPACLPTDLGTGIRLLRTVDGHRYRSEIRPDFWTNSQPGFAPLLYAMGASAAAFSACRYAVLAEGAADMILLPTLLRLATGLDDLEYQIAPGLATASTFDMRVEEVAAKVLYLTDGDSSGAAYATQLKEAGIHEDRIFSLPADWASEDLVERSFFVEVVNELLGGSLLVAEGDLEYSQPVVKSFEDWGAAVGVKTPGHVVIAYGMLNNKSRLRLAPTATKALQQLHEKFMNGFTD